MKIKKVEAKEVLDSKAEPTVKCRVELDDGSVGEVAVPSGASKGKYEALELRDEKGVSQAVANVNQVIRPKLIGLSAVDQVKIDQLMIDLDGTENKSRLGSNAIVAVSMAVCMSAAKAAGKPLYQYFGELQGNNQFVLPQPMILMLEGGKHGHWATDIQEYFIIPKTEKFPTFKERYQAGKKIFHSLAETLKDKGYGSTIGMEGGFCSAKLKSNEERLELMVSAAQKAGYKLPDEVVLGIDAAASEFFEKGKYVLKSEKTTLSPKEWVKKLTVWTKKYPLWSIEDPFDQEAWQDWIALTNQQGNRLQLVGDDLLVTNVKRIQKAIDLKAVNSVIIKPNQIGTVTEALEAVKVADRGGLTTIISHRGGETISWPLADLVVGTSSWQCKLGGPEKEERKVKYERLLVIEEELSRVSKPTNQANP